MNEETISELTAGAVPANLPEASQAALQIVDAVVERRAIPRDLQDCFVAVHGEAGVVEIVALCGLYGIMAMMTTSFDIPIEPGFPSPPFE